MVFVHAEILRKHFDAINVFYCKNEFLLILENDLEWFVFECEKMKLVQKFGIEEQIFSCTDREWQQTRNQPGSLCAHFKENGELL